MELGEKGKRESNTNEARGGRGWGTDLRPTTAHVVEGDENALRAVKTKVGISSKDRSGQSHESSTHRRLSHIHRPSRPPLRRSRRLLLASHQSCENDLSTRLRRERSSLVRPDHGERCEGESESRRDGVRVVNGKLDP